MQALRVLEYAPEHPVVCCTCPVCVLQTDSGFPCLVRLGWLLLWVACWR